MDINWTPSSSELDDFGKKELGIGLSKFAREDTLNT